LRSVLEEGQFEKRKVLSGAPVEEGCMKFIEAGFENGEVNCRVECGEVKGGVLDGFGSGCGREGSIEALDKGDDALGFIEDPKLWRLESFCC
jgi:hypothetical protein